MTKHEAGEMMSNAELIAEAREAAEFYDTMTQGPALDLVERGVGRGLQLHVRILADALEAAPVLDVEKIARAMQKDQYSFYTSMPKHGWDDLSDMDRQGYLSAARAVVAALSTSGGEGR